MLLVTLHQNERSCFSCLSIFSFFSRLIKSFTPHMHLIWHPCYSHVIHIPWWTAQLSIAEVWLQVEFHAKLYSENVLFQHINQHNLLWINQNNWKYLAGEECQGWCRYTNSTFLLSKSDRIQINWSISVKLLHQKT